VTANGVVRAGAVLGVVGGVLRVSGSFAPALVESDAARAWLYAVTDVCLMAGLLSLYLTRRHRMSAVGSIGLLLALGGLIANWIIPVITRVNVYPITAAAVAIGIVTLSFSEWQAGRMAAWIPAAFALSLVIGAIGMLVAGAGPLFIVSGILFGITFAAMGVLLIRRFRAVS
jgi:hypothetical protein